MSSAATEEKETKWVPIDDDEKRMLEDCSGDDNKKILGYVHAHTHGGGGSHKATQDASFILGILTPLGLANAYYRYAKTGEVKKFMEGKQDELYLAGRNFKRQDGQILIDEASRSPVPYKE